MNTSILEQYLTSIYPRWRVDIPNFADYFEIFDLERDEYLPSQRGDVYFVCRGTIGDYIKKTPKRYILENELIIISLRPQPTVLKALVKSTVMVLPRSTLYRISIQFPRLIELYDELKAKQDQALDFRITLLQMQKTERLEYFRSHYRKVIPLITRNELADFLSVSREYLRKIF